MRSLLILVPSLAPLLLLSCGTSEPDALLGVEPAPVVAEALELEDAEDDLDGLKLRLSEGRAPAPVAAPIDGSPAPTPVGEAAPTELSEDETVALLERMPALEMPERKGFAKREDSLPPPRTGATVHGEWPPPPSDVEPPADERAPLRVIRHAPEGEVPLAPHLSITFNHPMVAVTSQDEASKTVPVTLDPQPAGNWRWLGTKTLLFDPDPRFPMATEYTVTVPKGTVSAKGDALESELSWTFATPPPSVQSVWPYDGPTGLDPLVFVSFDQQVDDAALPFISLSNGSTEVPLRPATEAEIDDDESIDGFIDSSEPGRFMVLKPTKRLEKAASYRVEVAKGTPSAEGPRTTTDAWSESFYTYHPLRIDDHYCDWDTTTNCTPGVGMNLELNNPLDAKALNAADWTVEPALERMRVTTSGNMVTVHGKTKARTTYTLTVPASLVDDFGQTLGKQRSLTFKYGDAPKTLQGPGKEILVVDPAAPPAVSVYSTNHETLKLKVFEVRPQDFGAVSQWMRHSRYDNYIAGDPPIKRVANTTIKVEGFVKDELVETAIDLEPYLGDDRKGQLFVWVEPARQSGNRWDRIDIFAWVQVTDLGLTAWVDQDELKVWATRLLDGEPVPGVELSLLAADGSVTADADGLATLPKYDTTKGPHLLVAKKGDEVALLPEQPYWWNEYGGWTKANTQESLRWFTFDDRRMYRPGETVKLKGWVRRFDSGPMGQLDKYATQPTAMDWVLTDSRGNKLGEGETTLTDFGGFDLSIELPGTPNLGNASLQLNAKDTGSLVGSTHYHSFQIQEFRRPEFEVTTTVDPRPYVLGEHAYVGVDAHYYSGGALPKAPVTWSVTTGAASFNPPNWSGWAFGEYVPWWGGFGRGWWGVPVATDPPEIFEGETDATGGHSLKIDFLAMNPPKPMSVTAEATVLDVNRQRWTSAQTLTVHPSDRYVGLKTDKAFYEKDKPIEVQMVVVDLEGNAISDVDVALVFARLDWQSVEGVWQQVEVDPRECALTSAAKPAVCTFEPVEGGSHVVIAKLTDAEGRKNQTRMTVPVAGGKQKPNRNVELEQVTLIPEQQEYKPGDTARILVQAPFSPASGVWSVQRNGLVETHPFKLDGPTYTIELPITDAMVPNVLVDVDLVGNAPRLDDDGNPLEDKANRIAFASGSLTVSVPPFDRTLTVVATPKQAVLSPGGETEVAITVTDHAGKPVQSEVALVVVDESVLALTGATLPDPLAVFYATVGGGVSEYHLRSQVLLADPMAAIDDDALHERAGQLETTLQQGQLGLLGYAEGGDGNLNGFGGMGTRGTGVGGGGFGKGIGGLKDAESDEAPPPPPMAAPVPPGEARAESTSRSRGNRGGGAAQPIAVRADFAALALFSPHVNTDAAGQATVPLKLPDSLTRYRIMAVAVDRDRSFGASESNITARKPLMLRPSPPRFLNFGDKMELPLVVQNQTDAPMEVQLALRVANAHVLPSVDADAEHATAFTAGRALTIAANDRREVRIPVAADMAGTAAFQVIAVQKGAVGGLPAEDAATFEFPVWTPATSEAFATYGEVDAGGIVQPVKAPDDAWVQFGGLEVTTSSTAVQALTDAVLYLTQYPYECNEQISSRVLAIAALRDVLEAFEADQLPSASELEASVDADLARLIRRQRYDGGFGFWGDDRISPYITVHVTHTLVRAKLEGYDVDADALQRSLNFLDNIERHIPWWYSREARWSIVAYSVYTRHLLGDDDLGRARRLMKEGGTASLPLEAQGWILPTLHAKGETAHVDAIVRHLENNSSETAATAQFNTGYGDDNDYVLLHSSRRTDGILLDSLLQVTPDHDLIPKVVRGLLDHRVKGAWGTTQENAFVLLAMNRYFEVAEAETPDFVARVWLGDRFAGEHAFKGRTTERARIDVPMGTLTDPGGLQDLVLAKEGPGRMYYRIGMRYAPKSLKLEPVDHGFAVERVYEPIDDDGDVEKLEDGTWAIAAGARVRVRVTMVAPARRYHVALVDPLPGGLEAMNPDLAVTGAIPVDPGSSDNKYWWWSRTWYEHDNLRDERVEAFASLLWDGVHEYSYVATATTPGRFVVPPPKAEEMYHPETFGRGATDIVVIR